MAHPDIAQIDRWNHEYADPILPFTKLEAAFIVSAINHFDGMGQTRNDVLAKLRAAFTDDEMRLIKEIWGSRKVR